MLFYYVKLNKKEYKKVLSLLDGILVDEETFIAIKCLKARAQIELGMPTAITGLFQGVLLFFLLACDFLIHYKIVWQPSAGVAQPSSSSAKQGAA